METQFSTSMEPEKPEKSPEQPKKKTESGRCVQAKSSESLSEDCVETWEGGSIVCDGAGGECDPRVASSIISRVVRALAKQLEEIEGEQDIVFEEVCEKIIAKATGALACKAQYANTLTTLDIIHVAGNRLHIAHRGDGVVMVLNMGEKRGEMITMPSEKQSSIVDGLRSFVSPLGSRKEWGFSSWMEETEFADNIMNISCEATRKKTILEHIEHHSLFPKKLKDKKGKIYNSHEAIAEKAIMALEENSFLLSEDTQFYHYDCRPNEIIVAMSDGVFDNLVWHAQEKSLMDEGIEEREAGELISELAEVIYAGYIPIKVLSNIEGVFLGKFGENGERQFLKWRRKFMDISHWYKKVPTLLAELIYELQKQQGKAIQTVDQFAEITTNLVRNKFKKDDASVAAMLVR